MLPYRFLLSVSDSYIKYQNKICAFYLRIELKIHLDNAFYATWILHCHIYIISNVKRGRKKNLDSIVNVFFLFQALTSLRVDR